MKLSWKWVYCSIDTIKHPDKGIIIIQIKFSAPLHSLHYKLVFAVLGMQKNCSTATACTCHLSTFHKNRSVKRKQRASKIHTTITHNKSCTTAKQRLSQNPCCWKEKEHFGHSPLNYCKVACIPVHLFEYFKTAHFIYLPTKVDIVSLYCVHTEFNFERLTTLRVLSIFQTNKQIINKPNVLEFT